MHIFTDQAAWLVPPETERGRRPQSNEWFAFRSRLEACGKPGGVRLRIAADSKYWLFVNGEPVVREGGLKRGPVPGGAYFDEVDVSAFLREGGNTVALLLWYFGRHGFSHSDSGAPGLLVDADHAVFGGWRAKRHPAFFDAGYIHDAYRLSENSVGFDARHDLPGWTGEGFDDADWPAAVVAGKPGDAPWGPLERREFPQWFWSEAREYAAVEKQAMDDGYVFYRCKLPHNAHFTPGLRLRAKAGVRIDVSVAQDTNCLSPIYITREGEQDYESIGWMNGEEVVYKVPSKAVQVDGFFYRETGFPAAFDGHFACGEPLLDALWEKARRTLCVTMRDTFMDCPCRERAQWPGDMVVQLGQVPYCLGREADLLVKKGLRETLRWQREDGTIYGPVPAGNWRMELPAQMLAVVGPHGLWTYYMNTGDRATLAELYPFAKRYLDIWQLQSCGLIRYRPDEKGAVPKQVDGVSVGTWDWIDWGDRIDAEPALNAWFVLAAQGVRMMARELGLERDAQEVGRKERLVRGAIREHHWSDERGAFVSEGFGYDPDDRVQALAVLCGAADEGRFPQLLEVFNSVEQACPYMEKYVLEALFRMGEPVAALARMARRYRPLVENANSTLWERWPDWSSHPGTINHSWSGGPLTLLSECVAGIRPLEPGWRRFAVCPQPGGLEAVSASVCAPPGEIRLDARLRAGRWRVEVAVPPGAVAAVDFRALGCEQAPDELAGGDWSFEGRRAVAAEGGLVHA